MTDITRIGAGAPPAPPLGAIPRKDKAMMRFIRGAIVALMLTPGAGAAQDFEAGVSAHDANEYATALQEWRPLAEQGHALAQFNLGGMYRHGQGVPQDYGEAVRWYRMAAEQGLADAQRILGSMYYTGQGVWENDAEAIKWYRMAAEQGLADAQRILGGMHDTGQGVPEDDVTAHMWLSIAAKTGAPDISQKAAMDRAFIEIEMTAADISEAQRRARVCVNSGYQECD